MKTENSLELCRVSTLKNAQKLARQIAYYLDSIEVENINVQDGMPKLRHQLSELNQRIHEFNAYDNCLNTK